MNSIIARILIISLSVGALSCSTSSQSTRTSGPEKNDQSRSKEEKHEWFSGEKVKTEGDTLRVYATAIGTDSADAVTQAANRAALLMKRTVSDKLENIRSEAAEELGSDSDLAMPEFLFAFRQAVDAVPNITEVERRGAQEVSKGNGIRGVASVYLSKQEVIAHIDEVLASHHQWDAIKETDVFQDF